MEEKKVLHKKTALGPKLRFKEFKGNWKLTTLSSIGEFKNGINKGKEDFGIGVPFVNLMDVFGKETISDLDLGLVNANESEIKSYSLKKGDVLFIRSSVKKSGVGETSVVMKDLPNTVYSGFLIRYRTLDETIITKFKKYCFWTKTFRNDLISHSTTSANTNINQESLNKLSLNLPSLPEQEKIAAFLTAVDEKIQQLKHKKQLLEQYKKGVMQQLFSGKLRFKDENGKAYPKWEEKKLGEVARFLKGKGIAKTDIDLEGHTECIRYGQLYTDYKETISNVISRTSIPNEDLVLSVANDVIIPASGETQLDIATASCVLRAGIALGSDLNIIRTQMNGVFLSYYLNTKKKTDIARLSQGITVVHLYPSQLGLLKLLIPCLEEQKKIADFLSAIDVKINGVAEEIDATTLFKKGLLQQMFV